MRVFFLLVFSLGFYSAIAQNDSIQRRAVLNPAINNRSNDHFLLQFGITSWQGKPDSIDTKGFSRTANIYFMFDFPFRTNPSWSVALGPGIATDNIYFNDTYVGIKDATPNLVFRNDEDTSHFKKYKLTTAFLEAPVELRFTSKPNDNRHSFKAAVGVKVGTLLSAGTKGKTLQDRNNNTINDYTLKEKSKRFFNRNRLSVSGRVGYGMFSLFTSYSITPVFKEGLAPEVRTLTVGLTLSGL